MNTKLLDRLMLLMVGLLCYTCQSSVETSKYTAGFSEISKLYITMDSLMKMEGLQQAAFHYSSINDELSAILAYDQNCFATKPESIDAILGQYKFAPAKETVLEAAKSSQILIINEAHHQPSHRQFTKGLLTDLYANGYRHFGVEALDPAYFQFSRDTLPGFPHYYNGLLVQDPSMASLIRAAKKIGFTVFPYMSAGLSGAEREKAQVANISKYRDQHPSGKILIHCGYEHAREGKLNDYWVQSMAERLKDKIGVDPLTVDQTLFRQRGKEICERSLYGRFDGQEPSVLVPLAGSPAYMDSDSAWMDLYVFHPRLETKPETSGEFYSLRAEEEVIVRMYVDTSNLKASVPEKVIALRQTQDAIYYPEGTSLLLIERKDGTVDKIILR